MNFKIVISDPKTKKAYQKEVEQNASNLLGKKIGHKFSGNTIGLTGYELEVTGGSDKQGFPMRRDVEGTVRKKILIALPPGFRPKHKGQRRRKSICGNTVSSNTVQINAKIVGRGQKSVDDLLGVKPAKGEKSAEQKTESKPKEETKSEAKKEETRPEPKPEAKPEEKAPEKKEETVKDSDAKKEEPKPEQKPEQKTEAKPESKPKEEQKPEPEPEQKPSEPKPEAKSK